MLLNDEGTLLTAVRFHMSMYDGCRTVQPNLLKLVQHLYLTFICWNSFDDNGVLIKIYCMKSKLAHLCLYVCMQLALSWYYQVAQVRLSTYPSIRMQPIILPHIQGIPLIQWGQGPTRRTNTLSVPSMVTKHGLIEGSKDGGVELVGGGLD